MDPNLQRLIDMAAAIDLATTGATSSKKKEIKKELKKVLEVLKQIEKSLSSQASADPEQRKKDAQVLDLSIKKMSLEQDHALSAAVDVNKDMTQCVKHAMRCWRELGNVPYTWSIETKSYAKGWRILHIVETEGGHPEQQPGVKLSKKGKPQTSKQTDESKYADDPAGHWKDVVLKELVESANLKEESIGQGIATINTSALNGALLPVKTFHADVFKEYATKGSWSFLLTNACRSKMIELLKDEMTNLLAGKDSKLFTLVLLSAEEHWESAIHPHLVGLVNSYISKPKFMDLKVVGGQAGASKTVADFFAPIRSKHVQVFDPMKHGPASGKKPQDYPPDLKLLFTQAEDQLKTALQNVIQSKASSSHFEYAPIKG